MSFEAGNKCHRDTASSEATRIVLSGSAGEGGLDATPLQPAKARGRPSDIASPPKKKLKDDGSDDDSQAGDVSSPEGNPSNDSKNGAADGSADESGAEAATDGGIEALATVTRNASRRLRLLTADEKRVHFQEKYRGQTPEEILRKWFDILCTFQAADRRRLLQKSSSRAGDRRSTDTSRFQSSLRDPRGPISTNSFARGKSHAILHLQ